MRKSYLFLITLGVFSISCQDKSATEPVYVTINGYDLETNYTNEGTASSKITTVWVEADDQDIGAFEPPVTFPIIADGETKIKVTPGMNLNGVVAYRTKYDYYTLFENTYNFTPGTEVTLSSANSNNLITNYENGVSIIKLEDFEGAGTNLEPTTTSDTTLIITNDPAEIFSTGDMAETNTKSGKVVIPKGNSVVEFRTITSYVLPQYGADVYLEVNYKCEVPITFGIFSSTSGVKVQAPVVTVYQSDEWNKIYINLSPEISGAIGADSFEIFFGAVNSDATTEKTIFVDNMKIVY